MRRRYSDVGMELARIDWKIALSVRLGALDFAVPVSALHEAQHDAVLAASGEIDDPVQHEGRALLIGLNDEADAFPAFERLVEAEGFEQVQGEFETVGFFGVYIEADIIGAGQTRELGDAWQ